MGVSCYLKLKAIVKLDDAFFARLLSTSLSRSYLMMMVYTLNTCEDTNVLLVFLTLDEAVAYIAVFVMYLGWTGSRTCGNAFGAS